MKTDEQIQHDVINELKWEPSVDEVGIGVLVDGGIVTLVGSVKSFCEKHEAEQAVQRITGVKGMAVELEVVLPELNQRSDTDIARAAKNALDWTTCCPADAIKVMAEGGHVTLSGQVDWQYQRLAANDAIRHLMGVRGINDEITLAPMAALNTIKSDIEAALRRRSFSHAHPVSVTVHGGQVTLSGAVHSWLERESAEDVAWRTVGVRHVANDIAVSL